MNELMYGGTIAIALISAIAFYYLPRNYAVKSLIAGVFFSILLVASRYLLSTSNSSFYEVISDPPNWKLLGCVSATFGIFISIVLNQLFAKKKRK